MVQSVLLLGPVAFGDFEVASGIAFGGAQRIVQHDLPGGGRVIDALGDAPRAIVVSGILSGPDASLRARSLAGLRAAGEVLPLTWDAFFYSVVVQSFDAEYKSGWWIPFRLTCAVLRDEAAGLLGPSLSTQAAVVADVTAAAAAAPVGVDLSSAATAVAAPGASTRGTAAYGAASNALGAARSTMDASLATAESTLSPDILFQAGSASEGASALAAAAADTGQLAALSSARAYAGRAATNLSNAGT